MNLTGKWSGIASARGGSEGPVSMPVSFVFSQDVDKVSGTAESNNRTYEIRNGFVVGDRLALEIGSGDEYTHFDLTVQGERIQGHAMTKRIGGVMLNGALALSRVSED